MQSLITFLHYITFKCFAFICLIYRIALAIETVFWKKWCGNCKMIQNSNVHQFLKMKHFTIKSAAILFNKIYTNTPKYRRYLKKVHSQVSQYYNIIGLIINYYY